MDVSIIFNKNSTNNSSGSLFLHEEDMGLLDTVNKHYPVIFNLYKKMKKLDWDENEFDYSSCAHSFKICNRLEYDAMIKTLAWQWEADSIVSRHITPIVAPFISNTELWCAWSAIATNEVLHSLTYSEIVRNSFDNPHEVLAAVLEEKEALMRLNTVIDVMSSVYDISHALALGEIEKTSREAYEAIFMYVVALYCLERIQFIASFAITFGIVNTGLFIPIGKAVQKICQDEFEVHQVLDRVVLGIEMNTVRGRDCFNRNTNKIYNIINEVVEAEVRWSKYILGDKELLGLDEELLEKWVYYNAQEVYDFFSLPLPFNRVTSNPLPYMDKWMNIGLIQASPLEEKNNQYLLGGFIDDTSTYKPSIRL